MMLSFYFIVHRLWNCIYNCNNVLRFYYIVEELVVYVKQEMQRKGFLSREFASLPNDMSSGSREILLGFAWLLCKEGLIDKFMESCSSPLDEEDPSFMYEVRKKTAKLFIIKNS